MSKVVALSLLLAAPAVAKVKTKPAELVCEVVVKSVGAPLPQGDISRIQGESIACSVKGGDVRLAQGKSTLTTVWTKLDKSHQGTVHDGSPFAEGDVYGVQFDPLVRGVDWDECASLTITVHIASDDRAAVFDRQNVYRQNCAPK